jgi:hypothetical protein
MNEFEIVYSEVPRQPDRPLSERVADLNAECEEYLGSPVDERFARLLCDGCGRSVRLDPECVEMPDGWTAAIEGDYCPECEERRCPPT